MSKNNSILKVNVDNLIEEFNHCSKDLNKFTDGQNNGISLIPDKDNSSLEFKLLEISKKVRNLLKVGYVDGIERSEEYNVEGSKFYHGLQLKKETDRFRHHSQKLLFLENVQWHKIKVKEFVDELTLIKKFNLSNSKILSNKQQKDENPLEFKVSYEDHTGKIKVFISHKFVESDQKLASLLQSSLKTRGIYGYLAERKKEYDLVFGEKIKKEIESSDYLVAIMTENSLFAPSIHQEIGYALGVKVPVRIMAEQQEAKGVLVEGKDIEKFSRHNFKSYLDNIIKNIIKNGIRKKLSDEEKGELI